MTNPPRSVPRASRRLERAKQGRLPNGRCAVRELHDLLDQRIVVLDGAWGTMLQGGGAHRRPTTGLPGHDHGRRAGDPDLLNLTRPDVVLDVHRQYLAAGADITTTNTFTATSIGQADYGLQHAGPRDEPARRPAGPAGRRRGRRPVRRRLGRPAERHPVAVARGWRTRRTGRCPSTTVKARVRRADPGAGRRRRRPAADRDDLRHAQRQGRDRRRPRGRPAPAAVDLGHDRRPERPHPVRADRRGVLELDRARRTRWSSA